MTKGTLIPTNQGLKKIENFISGDVVYCVNEQGKTVETEVVAVHDHGYLEGFEVTFDDGYQVITSANHKFLTEKGQISLREICQTSSYIMCDQNIGEIYGKSKKRWVENSLWGNTENSKNDVFSSEKMSKVCGSCLGQENFAQSPLRGNIQHLEKTRKSFKDLRKLSRYKTRKYQNKNEQTQRGQSFLGEEKDIFRDSTQNLNLSRIIGEKSRKFKEMERTESREVCKMYRSCMEESQEIEDGNLVKGAIRLGFRENSLWKREKTSRFCKRQNLDRSGRLLSFFRTQEQFGKPIQTSNSSIKGSDVERRVFKKKRHNASEIEYGMFQEVNIQLFHKIILPKYG
jgi:hypothetical protein